MTAPSPVAGPVVHRKPLDGGKLMLSAYVYGVLLFILLPLVIIIPMSFSPREFLEFPPSGFTLRWYGEYLADRRWQDATILSLKVAVLTSIVATVIGTLTAYALARGRSVFAGVVRLLIVGPIVVPHIALAIALYLIFQRIDLIGTLTGFVAAHVVLALPFVIFTVAAALSRVDADLECAAMVCGASRLSAFRHVTLPMITPAVVSSALFAFIISFDEPVISFFVSSIRQRSLPRRLFEDIEFSLTPIIPAIATLLTLLSVIILVAAWGLQRWEQRRREGAAKS